MRLLLGPVLVAGRRMSTREFADGPTSQVGIFTDALMAEAKKQGWVVISVTND